MITENICEIESKAHTVFIELGYSKASIKTMLRLARRLIRWHIEQSGERWNSDTINNYVKYQEARYQVGTLSRVTFLAYKTMSEYLTQIYTTGTIIHKRRSSLPALPDCFERILSKILANNEWNLKFRKEQHKHISIFFRWLYSYGHNNLSRVDEIIARKYLTDCSARMVGSSLKETRRALKYLFLFISEDGTLSETMNKLFLFRIPIDNKIKPPMPQDEIASVLNVIDRSSMKGKRDYAMILLATVTGLRAIDIVELRLNSIDWRNGEIRITQEKTGKSLALPLTADVGKAIYEYVLYARPQSKSDKVFLCAVAPFGSIHRTMPGITLKKCRIKAGLTPHGSFHSLRRSIATNMVTSGVSVLTVAQTLGHRDVDSTKQYISLDSNNLKECSLDFSGIPIGG